MEWSTINLRRIIDSLKEKASKEGQAMLLTYLETEERIKMVFEKIKEEDSMGRFYCMVLLQKSLAQNRTQDELDRFLDSLQNMMNTVQFTSSLEISKAGAVYSTAALFYWPVRMPFFMDTVRSFILNRNVLSISILRNFLQLISDSLEITEERRYELKKSFRKVENEILILLYQHSTVVELLEVLLLMNRIDILNENIVVTLFKNIEAADSPTKNALDVFVNNISINGNSNVFFVILSYLYRSNNSVSVPFIENNISIVDSADKEIAGIVYKILTNTFIRIDSLSPSEIDSLLKVYLKLLKIYPKHFGKDLSAIVPARYDIFVMSVVSVVNKIEKEEEEHKSIHDTATGIFSTLSEGMKEANTEMFRKYYQSIPVNLSEVFIKNLICPVYTGHAYLDLKQSCIFKDYAGMVQNIGKIEMKTSKECHAVKEAIDALVSHSYMREEEAIYVYNRCLSINNYYSIDLAVSIGIILKRDDLIVGTVQGFKGKGVVGFISIVEKCKRLVFGLFPQFKEHILTKDGDMVGEIDAVGKILEAETGRNSPAGKGEKEKSRANAMGVVGREIVEKIFLRIDTGSIMEIRKISKILPYLEGRIHEVFLQKIWLRMKTEIDRQVATGDYESSMSVQSIVASVASECRTAEEAQILYAIVESEEYSGRSVLVGVKKILEGSKESAYFMQVLSAMISVLVSIYVTHSDENTRATVVGIIIDKEERIQAMERVYQIDLSEVYAAKEKRAVMKRVLRQIEGMNEKQGALLKKPKKQEGEEDKWADITTPFM